MQAHPIRRQAIRRRGLAEARSAEAVAPERGVRGTYKLSPERRAKGGLGCPVSHPEHGDTLTQRREDFLPLSVKCRGFRSSRAETLRNSFFKPVDTSNNTGFHHRYHRPDSFSVILCVSAPLRETCSTPIAESAGIPE